MYFRQQNIGNSRFETTAELYYLLVFRFFSVETYNIWKSPPAQHVFLERPAPAAMAPRRLRLPAPRAAIPARN